MLGAQRDAFWPSVMMQATGRLHLELLIYTAAAGSGAALVLHQRYRDRELAAARLQAELAAARLDALQGHLQPHFLFNSLHSIASLARAGDNAGVVRLIAGFSEILRHLLDEGDAAPAAERRDCSSSSATSRSSGCASPIASR